MNCFLVKSSLGRKLVMAVSGCFLVLFLLFHMAMNLAALFSADAYNMICAFLGANWYALVALYSSEPTVKLDNAPVSAPNAVDFSV